LVNKKRIIKKELKIINKKFSSKKKK